MSETVRLSSKLSKDEETNGLDQLHDTLKHNPKQAICAIVWLDVQKVTNDIDSGTDIPTVRVRRIEPIGAVDKVPESVIALAGELFEKRTGRPPLPFDTLEFIDGGYVGDVEEN